MIFKIHLYGISQIQMNDDSILFIKFIFRDLERTTSKFVCNSKGCLLDSSITWEDQKPVDEFDILTVELHSLKKSYSKKISLYQTLMESYSPYRVYYLSEQFENGVSFNFSLYYENDDNLLITSSQLNCKSMTNLIDFANFFKQSHSSKSKMISYGTFTKNKV